MAVLGWMSLVVTPVLVAAAFPQMEAAHQSLCGVSGHICGVAITEPLLEQHMWLEEQEGYEGAAHYPTALGSSLGFTAACSICSGTSLGS